MNKTVRSLTTINPLSITIYLTLLVVVVFLVRPSFLAIVELKTLDLRFKSRGLMQANDAIVLAVIDEKSLDKEGRWPWPRSKIARLVDYLSDDEAKVIGFDIGFLEPDENNNLSFIQQLESKIGSLRLNNKELERFLSESKRLADNDRILAHSIKQSKAKVILGYFLHMDQKSLGYEIESQVIDDRIFQVSKSKYPIIQFPDANIGLLIDAYSPEVDLPIVNRSADSSGYFNMIPDLDGAVRWFPLVIRCRQAKLSPLSIQCVWHYLDRPPLILKTASYGVARIQMGDISIPTDEKGQMMINYLGPPKTFTHYPITDIINDMIPKGTFKDKIVLVGATALAIYDMRNTPFSSEYPGVEVHATIIDNILEQNFLIRPDWIEIFDLLAIILMGVVIGLVIPRLDAVKGILFAICVFTAHILLSRLFFVNHGLWLNITYPLAALIVLYVSHTIYKYLTEERERKKIKGAFTYYVSSSVVNEMLKHPEKLKLGGERKELTVLFSDIKGFTTIAEGLTPEELVNLLNEYLTVMTDVVFKYDGTLDKYIGDAIMAVYGAPLDLPDHPYKACQSALEMVEELERLNEKWIGEGRQAFDIRIGINTGPMMVGNMGSKQRFDFTAMGDSVNLGSRLEGANKSYKTSIIIGELTYESVKNEFVCMELDSVRVKGKKQPVKIYNLIGYKDLPGIPEEIVIQFNEAVTVYKERKWDEAIQIFENVAALDPDLYAAQLYIERCNNFKKSPPPADWDGVYVMTSK
ncbi:MAG: adenylate/guanylate cyclase domain-containing protein [Deltaproteobacteria bacterium]|nr:MAG: adenylate/guanylate cyclase domain-containing protein [Deltaproteobacteria bacterium]